VAAPIDQPAPAVVQPTVPPAPAPQQPAAAPSSTIRPHQPVSTDVGPSLLHWLVVLIAGALIFQGVALALRPVRRLIALRHLRRPFWDETVDQRVSNSWQLALIGLRDAGWRSTSGEAPREFARRVGVDGLERCATILERARHGIGIDAEDLGTMSRSAETAYHSARGRLGPLSRLIAWIRWPLT